MELILYIMWGRGSMEKAMAPHSNTLAWKIPWMEEPGRLWSMGSLRVRYDWATSLSLFTFMYWRRKWQPTPVFLPGESQEGGAWWAAVSGVAQSRTRLKWLSSSSRGSIYVIIHINISWLSSMNWNYYSFPLHNKDTVVYKSVVWMHVVIFLELLFCFTGPFFPESSSSLS